MERVEENDSHYGFGMTVKYVAEMFEPFAASMRKLAHVAGEIMPTDPGLRDAILQTAAVIDSVAKDADLWYATWKNQHPRTVDRVRDPYQGNPHKEKLKDSGRARRAQ